MRILSPVDSMSLIDFLSLPEDESIERELIRGELKERAMTKRNRFHARTEARLVQLLRNWRDTTSEPRGDFFSGEVGCILHRNPPSIVGIDIAYFSAETVAGQSNASTMVEGAPVLAIEILSPSDKQEDITEKVDAYLGAKVAVVWIVDPHFKTITVYRDDTEPELFNVTQVISDQPQMPGLRVPVRELFE